MRSGSAKSAPQQPRNRPNATTPAADTQRTTGGSAVNRLMISMMLLTGHAVFDPASTTVQRQYNTMGLGSTPYDAADMMRPALQGLAGLVNLDEDEERRRAPFGISAFAAETSFAAQSALLRQGEEDPAAMTGDVVLPSDDSDVMEIESVTGHDASLAELEAPAAKLDVVEVDESMPHLQAAASPMLPATKFSDITEAALASALQYLTLPTLNQMRVITERVATVTSWIAPRPFGDNGAVFMRWLETPPNREVVANAPPTAFCWRCVLCSQYSDNHQVCTCCGERIEKSACRVFLGQLRKHNSAASAAHMIRALLPGVTPLHIESHSNRSGHEKGCAWVYMNELQDCHRLIDLSKRVYFDVDGDSFDGFWVVAEGERSQLHRFAELRHEDTKRPAVLPRQPLVAEFPMGSALRKTLADASQAFSEAHNDWASRAAA